MRSNPSAGKRTKRRAPPGMMRRKSRFAQGGSRLALCEPPFRGDSAQEFAQRIVRVLARRAAPFTTSKRGIQAAAAASTRQAEVQRIDITSTRQADVRHSGSASIRQAGVRRGVASARRAQARHIERARSLRVTGFDARPRNQEKKWESACKPGFVRAPRKRDTPTVIPLGLHSHAGSSNQPE